MLSALAGLLGVSLAASEALCAVILLSSSGTVMERVAAAVELIGSHAAECASDARDLLDRAALLLILGAVTNGLCAAAAIRLACRLQKNAAAGAGARAQRRRQGSRLLSTDGGSDNDDDDDDDDQREAALLSQLKKMDGELSALRSMLAAGGEAEIISQRESRESASHAGAAV